MSWGREKYVADDEAKISDLVDIAGEKRGETENAIRWFDGARSEWIPKSQCQENSDGTLSMPEWLAIDKGFV